MALPLEALGAAMTSHPQPYNSDHLKMLTCVLKDALQEVMRGHTGALNEAAVEELATRLAEVLMDQFKAGQTDAAVLKKIAVDAVQQQ
jgi:hypothetical protein